MTYSFRPQAGKKLKIGVRSTPYLLFNAARCILRNSRIIYAIRITHDE